MNYFTGKSKIYKKNVISGTIIRRNYDKIDKQHILKIKKSEDNYLKNYFEFCRFFRFRFQENLLSLFCINLR
jgi:hypothetical protein